MSEPERLSPEELERWLATYRQESRERLGSRDAPADRPVTEGLTELLALLVDQADPPEPTEIEEEEMNELLSQVLSDALRGEDIRTRYPAFYRRLLGRPALMELFLDALQALDSSAPAITDRTKFPPRLFDLSFLNRADPAPRLNRQVTSGFSVGWILDLATLADRLTTGFFFEAQPMRSAVSLDDEEVILLQDEFKVAGSNCAVTLSLRLDLDRPDELRPVIVVRPDDPDFSRSLTAILDWPPVREKIAVDRQGQGTFSPLPLVIVFDEDSQPRTPLSLTLVRDDAAD